MSAASTSTVTSSVAGGFLLGALAMLLIPWDRPPIVELGRVDVVSRLVRDARVPEAGYPTPVAAVAAASNRFNPDSIARDREHVGGILRCPGAGYFYTHGVGRPGRAPVRFAVAVPHACTLVCLWHTHGGPYDDRELFSTSDTQAAEQLNVPIYMTNHTGQLRVYRPGATRSGRIRAAMSTLRLPSGTAAGELVRAASGRPIRIATR